MCLRKKVMKHTATHSANSRFHQVQEELKNLLSIIMGTVEEAQENENFEYLEQNATSEEELSIIKELNKSSQALEQKAEVYHHNIGIPSVTKKQTKQSKKEISVEGKISTIVQPMATQNKEDSKNNRISRIKDDFDIEH